MQKKRAAMEPDKPSPSFDGDDFARYLDGLETAFEEGLAKQQAAAKQ